MVLADLLKGKRRIALGGHVRPDGDCVGSTMGLYLYLKEQYPDIETDLYLEEVPQAFQIIHHTEEVKTELPEAGAYDLFICLDCGDIKRLGCFSTLFEQAGETACIDHHISNEAFADYNYIVPDASSTSELVFTLLEEEKISRECAEALYMGIAHDTGVFQYSCTSPETMELSLIHISGTWYLRAYIDKPGGITVDDCETVSRKFSDILDEKDYIEDSYIFEVSSPGLGRPLKKEKDFKRSLGEEVEIRTYRAIERQKEFVGILKEYDKETVTIAYEDESTQTLKKSEIALIRLALDF